MARTASLAAVLLADGCRDQGGGHRGRRLCFQSAHAWFAVEYRRDRHAVRRASPHLEGGRQIGAGGAGGSLRTLTVFFPATPSASRAPWHRAAPVFPA